MQRTASRVIALLAIFVLAFAMAPVAHAQHAPPHKRNFVQRHPTLTGVAAGVTTHHALKVSAAHKRAHGKKLNWAERHPTLTAVGVGAATRHVIKKHTH